MAMDLNERLKKAEQEMRAKSAEIERRLQKTMSSITGTKAPAAQGRRTLAAGAPLSQSAKVDMTKAESLSVLDEVMEEQFELQRFLGGSLVAYPTTYCESVREYATPIIAGMPMSETQREGVLTELEQAAERGVVVPILCSLGVHVPGVGCFINGWYLGRSAGISPADYYRSPKGFARIVTTTSHEKWGHGFISERTALGGEKRAVRLDMHHLADQFEVRTVDTPDHARLAEQWEILFFGSNYVEEGFATWIERFLAERLAERGAQYAELPQRAPRFTAQELTERLAKVRNGAEPARAIAALLHPRQTRIEGVHQALEQAIAAVNGLGDQFVRAVGMPAPYALGYCMVDAIAQRQGAKCVPYAVATACNVKYGLEKISNQDLRNYVARQPNLNVNTRLAAMMCLEPHETDDVEDFVSRVRSQIGLTPPQ